MPVGLACTWTEDEDKRLIDTLVKLGNVPWKTVAKSVKGRTSNQCRDRFHKSIKKAARYRNMIPDCVLVYRRNTRGVPVPVEEFDGFAEYEEDSQRDVPDATVDHAFGTDAFTIDMPIDAELSIDDKFSFEEICELGAMPHLTQPVPMTIPSPTSLAALPLYQPLFAEEPAIPPSRPSSPVAGTITIRVTPKVQIGWSRVGGVCATAGPIGPANSFVERHFSKINQMVSKLRLLKAPQKRVAALKMAAPMSTATPSIVFNPLIVRPIA